VIEFGSISALIKSYIGFYGRGGGCSRGVEIERYCIARVGANKEMRFVQQKKFVADSKT